MGPFSEKSKVQPSVKTQRLQTINHPIGKHLAISPSLNLFQKLGTESYPRPA
ncbi:hypothetical protein LEP1GSC005_3016 [Leptospira santarosai str. ST188]|nr:hypothetical protein LEP1GSC005_3016 [Leptospira santarosai str. ST188]EMO71295.1 hypothetical protein LEP1GSC130_2847 [Leptospira santarosai str. 200403458]EMO97731.1 hypothetical protein LEP1GSC120_3612 [Leptospira santarosai str. 200702252]